MAARISNPPPVSSSAAIRVVDPSLPRSMTSAQRRAELAGLLAAGLIRYFERRRLVADPLSVASADSGDSRLEVPPGSRPYGRVVNASRERENKKDALR